MDRSIFNRRGVWFVYTCVLWPCFIEISVFNANSVDPDQTPRFAASDLGPHCLPMPYLLWEARLKWVNIRYSRIFLIFLVFHVYIETIIPYIARDKRDVKMIFLLLQEKKMLWVLTSLSEALIMSTNNMYVFMRNKKKKLNLYT